VHHQPHDHRDAEPADPRDLGAPGPHQCRETWQIVIIRVEGRWQPGLLTIWRRCPGYWAAYVRWRMDPDPAKGWGWFRHDPATIRPLTVEGLESAGLGGE
jgi:hypothetical protein